MIEIDLTEKPDYLALTDQMRGFFPALLESQSLNEKIGRYDILFAAPSIEMVAYDSTQLNQLLDTIDSPIKPASENGPFQFGWLVYFSYESAYHMESKLEPLLEKVKEPLAVAIHCQGAVVHDRINNATKLYAQSEPIASEIQNRVAAVRTSCFTDQPLQAINLALENDFKQAVVKAKELIKSGDIYQANLSRKYQYKAPSKINAASIYASLSASNPAPFAGMLQLHGFVVVSSSPERLFSIRNGTVETRPIAGTRPRGNSDAVDLQLIEELLDTPKERAEHIMLIDLERNDMGKVCQIGTVKVDELMVIESYQHVHHIVSNITGQLKSDMTVVDVIKALFPGGTITGCPKIRCMEVIHEIEQAHRGSYTGSMGYINHDGQVDLNILIRTVAILGDQLSFNAGAGIVYDSDPEAELEETKHKAQGMVNALKLNEERMLIAKLKG